VTGRGRNVNAGTVGLYRAFIKRLRGNLERGARNRGDVEMGGEQGVKGAGNLRIRTSLVRGGRPWDTQI